MRVRYSARRVFPGEGVSASRTDLFLEPGKEGIWFGGRESAYCSTVPVWPQVEMTDVSAAPGFELLRPEKGCMSRPTR